MKDISLVANMERWYALLMEAENWDQVVITQKGFAGANQEILTWLSEAKFSGHYSFGMHPEWDDHFSMAFENKNAAFAFKMRFGGL